MNFLTDFHYKILKYELINKFNYQNTKNLPELKKIIFNFNCKTSELKSLSIHLLAIELITKQKGTLTKSKQSNILLKIRKGHPVGCKVILRKNQMFRFFGKIGTTIFPKIKNFKKFNRKVEKNAFLYHIHDIFSFSELEQHYHIFSSISKLDITLVSNSNTRTETLFLLKSLQFPLETKNRLQV